MKRVQAIKILCFDCKYQQNKSNKPGEIFVFNLQCPNINNGPATAPSL